MASPTCEAGCGEAATLLASVRWDGVHCPTVVCDECFGDLRAAGLASPILGAH